MPIAMINARAVEGIRAPLVRIETHLANGLPSFQIVGLPEAAVRESRDRVRAAIQTSGFEFPRRRITVNLAPADSNPRPGEISLAHNGVLFLDEMTEFDRRVLDVLREPLETGVIHIARAARQAEYPARFQLVGAMNPCPQGFDCDLADRCQCSPEQRARHRRRLSAPLIDRIDIAVEVPRLPTTELVPVPGQDEDSATIGARVRQAHAHQRERQGKMNSVLSGRELDQHAPLSGGDRVLLEHAVEKFRLSARAYHRILRVARSIADLADSRDIGTSHLTEALGFRALDRWRLD